MYPLTPSYRHYRMISNYGFLKISAGIGLAAGGSPPFQPILELFRGRGEQAAGWGTGLPGRKGRRSVTACEPPCPALYAEHDAIWYGMSLWSVGVSCPSCVPSQPLVPPQPARWWGRRHGIACVGLAIGDGREKRVWHLLDPGMEVADPRLSLLRRGFARPQGSKLVIEDISATQPQFPQPLLIRLLLQTLHQLRCPSLDTLQHLNVSLVVGGPKLNTVFEVRPHQCRVQGHDHFPTPAGHTISDTSQDAIGLLGHLGTLLAHIQAAVNQHPQRHRLERQGMDLTEKEVHACLKKLALLTKGWRLNHFPGQPVPMLDNPLGEEKFPNILSKPPLAQLEAISSCPITCYLGEETDPHLSTTSFQAKQSQFPQPLLLRLLLQTLHQLRCPSLDTLQHLNVSLVVGGPKLNTVFEVRPHQCRVQGHDHFPSPAGHAIFDTSQDAIGLLGRLGTLLAHIQAAVNQHPQVLLCQAAFQPLFPKPVALHGVAVAQVQDLALGLVKPHTIDLGPSIQPVQVPLQSLPTLQQINTPTQLGVVCKLTESTLDPFVQIIDKDLHRWEERNDDEGWRLVASSNRRKAPAPSADLHLRNRLSALVAAEGPGAWSSKAVAPAKPDPATTPGRTGKR
ncbi:hypothetical protein QYF61_005154 [Mycteria americana]|uniref:Uncharacterized protein n=1 Tax=Mycteria americana TaxID=33587 RepID=A0AAN7NP46_MYCAM|nr:hypothetical protein QYF61_005154 [Mycteria americana]